MLPANCFSDCMGVIVEGFTYGEIAVVAGESKTEAVFVVAWDEVDMEVKYLLAGGLSVGDEPVDSIASECLVERSRDSAGNREEMGGGRVVQVGNSWRVGCWN